MPTLTTAADIQRFILSEVAKSYQTGEFTLQIRSGAPAAKFQSALKALQKSKLVDTHFDYPSNSYSCTLSGRYELLTGGSKKLPFPAKAVNAELDRIVGVEGVWAAYSYRKNSDEIYLVLQGNNEDYVQRISGAKALTSLLQAIPSGVGEVVVSGLVTAYGHGYEDGRSEGFSDGMLEGSRNND